MTSVGERDDGLMVTSDDRRDYADCAIEVWSRHKYLYTIQYVGASCRLMHDLRKTRTLDNVIVRQLIQVAGQNHVSQRKVMRDFLHTRLHKIQQLLRAIYIGRGGW